jgi:hypothetical protein
MPIASSRAPRRPADLPANSVRAGSAKGGSKTTRMGSLFAARLRTTRLRMVGIPSTTSLLKLVVLVSVVTTISVAPLGNQKPKGLVIPDEAKASSATMSAWIDSNRDRKRRRRSRKTAYKPAGSAVPQSAGPTKRSRKRNARADVAPQSSRTYASLCCSSGGPPEG